MVIHLSGLPGDIGRAGRPTFDLAPGGVYRAARVTPGAGALLPHRFTLACDCGSRPPPIGGLFSVALSCGSPRLAVSQHPALRSPDLPRQGHAPNDAGTRLATTTQPTHSSRRFYRQLPATRTMSPTSVRIVPPRYPCPMRTVVLGPPPAELEALIARRHSLGLDGSDEVWKGEYHMAPVAHLPRLSLPGGFRRSPALGAASRLG